MQRTAQDDPPTTRAEDHTGPASRPADLHPNDTYRGRYTPAEIDWTLARTYRQQASTILAPLLESRPGIDDDDRRELGRSVVRRLLTDRAQDDALAGTQPLSPAAEAALAHAVLDMLFELGRLQPLLDDPTLEDIEITGYDHVVLMRGDGSRTLSDPVADSDEELIDTIAFYAAHQNGQERPFSPAACELRLSLAGRARLHAIAWDTPRPVVRIRMHRHIDVTLDDLERMGEIDHTLNQFLRAAVAAKLSIVVAGSMGAGKTTMTRALARAIPAWESIAVLESEAELFLEQVDDRLRPAISIQARIGSGEIGANGRRAGERTVDDQFPGMLRLNADRCVIGEVRGTAEITAMFSAMRSGAGSLSTIHAKTGADTADRLATLLQMTGMDLRSAHMQVAKHIDLIVYLASRRDPVTGRRYRYVAEIVEVTPGSGQETGTATEPIFTSGPDGRAVPAHEPTFMAALVEHGFDRAGFDHRESTWAIAMEDLR